MSDDDTTIYNIETLYRALDRKEAEVVGLREQLAEAEEARRIVGRWFEEAGAQRDEAREQLARARGEIGVLIPWALMGPSTAESARARDADVESARAFLAEGDE
jgi:hypothetical protein